MVPRSMLCPTLPPLLSEALTARGYAALTPVQTAVLGRFEGGAA